MKIVTILTGVLAASPAFAHEAGPMAHVHPHGTEAAVALAAVALLAFAAWTLRR